MATEGRAARKSSGDLKLRLLFGAAMHATADRARSDAALTCERPGLA